MTGPGTIAPFWKRVLAPILDFLMVFFVGGNIIGMATGMNTPGGFNLQGWPALLLFVLVAVYFSMSAGEWQAARCGTASSAS